MIKISHECPLEIFEQVQKVTDYDYFLVHLFDEIPKYKEKYFQAKEKARETILDNSIFELGKAFDQDKFAKKILELEPDWYIIPDSLENYSETVKNNELWKEKYSKLPGKRIGVVQGKTYQQLLQSYTYWDEVGEVDMIAISFDYSWYEKAVPHPNKYVSWALGRVMLLGKLVKDEVINVEKPHHLLGCSIPLEFKLLNLAGYNWIYSIDTSNPIVHAIKGHRYESNFGLTFKDSQKLFTLMNYPKNKIDKEILLNNILEFRKLVNG